MPSRSATIRAAALIRTPIERFCSCYMAPGLRISEALALTLADVDLDSGILCIRESKFYKTRLVPIGADLIRILNPHTATTATTARRGRFTLFCFPQRRCGDPAKRRDGRFAAYGSAPMSCVKPPALDINHACMT